MSERKWNIVGLMSGTSLDGLDMAYCEFVTVNNTIKSYKIIKGLTINYEESDKEKLKIMDATASTLAEADFAFGRYCGEKVQGFIIENHLEPDFIASHGHTIFHQPDKGFTTQIGNGAAISAACNLPVVSDFRSMDVALGGQGAPLVPIGDLLLFAYYQYCLNLGGIANISIKHDQSIIAFDVCPANLALNRLAQEKGISYDEGGNLAKAGIVNDALLNELNGLHFYKIKPPKSLGKEWFDNIFIPVFDNYPDSVENKLCTVCEHIASQIANQLQIKGDMIVTGGGAFNSWLIERIQFRAGDKCKVIVPGNELVNFKEALIFAFLGLLRVLNSPNALTSVTGAKYNSIGGALYGDISKLYT